MSFKNKLFKTNIKVAFVPILFFFILIVVILGIYRHLFLNEALQNDYASEELQTTVKIIRNFDYVALNQSSDQASYIEKTRKELDNAGFSFGILNDNDYIFNNLDHNEATYLYEYTKQNLTAVTDVPIIASFNDKHLVFYHTQRDNHNFYVVALSDHHHMGGSLLENNVVFFLILLMILLVCIFILMLCRRYSKRMVQQLMVPILELGKGAKQIQDGNLEVQLNYDVNDEFKPVFDSFNEMQTRLKESILLSLEREQKQQEMVAEISHDLKTPLTSIKGYVKGLEDGVANTPEKQTHYMQKIDKKVDSMTALIDEILMYSRLERNRITFTIVPMDIDSYLQEVLIALQEEYSEDRLTLHFTPGASHTLINLDTLQFNRVINNLIGNSLKYSGKQQTTVNITTALKDDTVTITFQDNGKGIEEDKLVHIFEPFYRADDARKNPTDGSGLGLAIVHHVISQLSGTISAASDNGFCITMTFPQAKENADATDINS